MKIKDLIEEKKLDPDFYKSYQEEGEKLQTAISIYSDRKDVRLSQKELAEKSEFLLNISAWFEKDSTSLSFKRESYPFSIVGKYYEVIKPDERYPAKFLKSKEGKVKNLNYKYSIFVVCREEEISRREEDIQKVLIEKFHQELLLKRAEIAKELTRIDEKLNKLEF